jgi:DNA-binding NarL/FixJ family response regulator
MSIPTGSSIRVVIIDDLKIVREGLCKLIEAPPGLTVVGDAGNCADALKVASSTQPDIIILELGLDQCNDSGLELLPKLLVTAPEASVIILTSQHDAGIRDKAMELGAKGVVLKENGAVALLNAIKKVYYTGEYWFEQGVAKRLLEKNRAQRSKDEIGPETARIAALTPREREIISLIGEGLENKEIAERLRPIVAESTVRNNLSIIYDKLGIKGGRLALLVYSYKQGLIKAVPQRGAFTQPMPKTHHPTS